MCGVSLVATALLLAWWNTRLTSMERQCLGIWQEVHPAVGSQLIIDLRRDRSFRYVWSPTSRIGRGKWRIRKNTLHIDHSGASFVTETVLLFRGGLPAEDSYQIIRFGKDELVLDTGGNEFVLTRIQHDVLAEAP